MRAFAFAVYDVKKTPQVKSRTTSSGTDCTGAMNSSQIAKPAAPTIIVRHDARANAAADSAPIRAPQPKAAERIPNGRGPESSVCFASTGRRMLKLKQRLAKTTI